MKMIIDDLDHIPEVKVFSFIHNMFDRYNYLQEMYLNGNFFYNIEERVESSVDTD